MCSPSSNTVPITALLVALVLCSTVRAYPVVNLTTDRTAHYTISSQFRPLSYPPPKKKGGKEKLIRKRFKLDIPVNLTIGETSLAATEAAAREACRNAGCTFLEDDGVCRSVSG